MAFPCLRLERDAEYRCSPVFSAVCGDQRQALAMSEHAETFASREDAELSQQSQEDFEAEFLADLERSSEQVSKKQAQMH